MSTTSWWTDSAVPLYYEPLTSDARVDVCVVGAGIPGLTTAYLLAQEGRRVMLLDGGPVGFGASCRTTGHLSNALDDRYYGLERLHGQEGARIAASSHTDAIRRIERICRRESIDCDFKRVDGYLVAAEARHLGELERELEATHRAGLVDTELVPHTPFQGWDDVAALRFPRQAQLHCLNYLNALSVVCFRSGVAIHCRSHATAIESGRVEVDGHYVVQANHIVVATNSPVNHRVSTHTKQHACQTYVIAGNVPHGSVPAALCWDTADPYHYARIQHLDSLDLLIVGGEDHRTGQADDGEERFKRLEAWTRKRFPMLAGVRYRWSGQVMEPVDRLGFAGLDAGGQPEVYVITGDSGNGLTHGTLGAAIVCDLICGRENEWSALYSPSRITVVSGVEYIKDNVSTGLRYGDWLTSDDADGPEDIAPGQGAVIRRGLAPRAVYRTADGEHVCMSAACPHLGCIVSWNSTEETWDCPCHGSRFNTMGEVIHGPANRNLERLGDEE